MNNSNCIIFYLHIQKSLRSARKGGIRIILIVFFTDVCY
ncbi:hypothetical protein VP277E431_P0261 [Vibrio phage 277E43-1]|nr:hypothetical protein VP277E431_P0261 [Vibrio phage 277E43-1]